MIPGLTVLPVLILQDLRVRKGSDDGLHEQALFRKYGSEQKEFLMGGI